MTRSALSSGADSVSFEMGGKDPSCDNSKRAVARFQIEIVHKYLIKMINLDFS